jgi:eukaryotic-like serine/threonine-protein kinase
VYPQVFGKYVLERELSRGGMARVVLATLRGAGGFEKRLVVKQIRDELSFDQQFVRRFVEEAKTTVALSHPNIVPVYELGVEQGTYFLAMELVEGCSIAELVRERNFDGTKRVLTPEEGAYIGMEVCRALDYAHRRMKVVHRDITPRNVMLDEEGQVKLIDFGIAAPALVAGHEILGSPGHMPPEQVEGKELGPATDIFAVAVLLMEGWSGSPTFRRATPEECDAAMRQPHPKPSDFNPRLIPLDDVIVRAMKLDPKDRQQDASDLGRALRAFLQGTDVTDIARALGDRVRDLRQAASEPHPMSLDGSAARAPNPSVGDLGTQTFAAREEAIRWSRPPADEIEPPGASTRRLEAPPSEPSAPSLETPRAGPASDRRLDTTERKMAYTRSADDAMSIPTPLLVEPVGTNSDILRTARAAQEAARAAHASDHPPRSREKDERADTLATRGLETAGRRSERSAPRSRMFTVVVLAALFVIGGGVAWRARATNGRTDIAPTATATTVTPSATTPPTVSVARPAPSSDPSASPTPSGAVFVAPTTHSGPSTSASATEKPGKALVRFLGEPGTRVSIDGASRGSTPVSASLDPGQHDVRFQFDPTGESRGERFSVKANERVQVRAEFTGATPTIRIQR